MKRFLLTALPFLILAGCYPGGPDYVEDLDAVYTTYDDQFDFQSRSTYARPDKIVVDVKIEDGDTTYVYMLPKFADPLLAQIDDHMQELGWELVDIEEDPDVLLSPAALKSTTYFYSYWYDWWYGGWWGWYYPPYVTVSSYTTGSLIITLADPNVEDDSPINQSQAAWVCVANGLYTGAYDVSRVTTALNDAFAQSPYLKIN